MAKKIELEVPDDFTPFTGVALFSGTDEEGNPQVQSANYGDIRKIETIGLLTAALDQVRHDFLYGEPEDD